MKILPTSRALAPLLAVLSSGCLAPGDRTPPPAPLEPLPAPRQLAWQAMGFNAFVHFNMNTFTDLEWGHGTEAAEHFQPTALDCRQWARVAREAGMRGIVLTAKHHDGFCLWPSELSEHTVARSPWRGGKGDVLRELSEACRAEGLGFGVYLSPWDRNHPAYGTDDYNQVFAGQLREVLTGYGEVFEVWFDGANGEGPNGRKQVYDWPLFVSVVRECQPGAVIFSDAGPDVRWVGNERGHSDETCWSMLRRDEFEPGTPRYGELTQGHEDGTHWVPPECDVSIRPGWYYHADQDDQVKTPAQLEDLFHRSVGQNSLLLLNLPVDRRGLVHENDVAALRGLRGLLDATYDVDLARGASATATNARGEGRRFAASRVVDGDRDTYWAADDGVTRATLELELAGERIFDRVLLAERIELGQRVRSFSVEARHDGRWTPLARGTTIGFKRILRVPPTAADALRVTLEDSRAAPTLASLELYASPPAVEIIAPEGELGVEFQGRTVVALRCEFPGATIHYTLDGREPTSASPAYVGPLTVRRSCTLRALAFLDGRASPREASVELKALPAEQP